MSSSITYYYYHPTYYYQSTMFPKAVSTLVDLGFTQLEALAYGSLLTGGTATGYAVARELNKPTANVYKALDSLLAKGAVEAEHGETTYWRSVPPRELMGRLEREFESKRHEAEAALSKLPEAASDNRVYQLGTPEQVYERLRQMVDGAATILLLDVFPQILDDIRPEIDRAVKRGVRVGLKAYAPAEIPEALVTIDLFASAVLERWPAQWIVVSRDGGELLQALFDGEGRLLQAVWSQSPFLAWVLHSYLAADWRLAAIEQGIVSQRPRSELSQLSDRLRHFAIDRVPGYDHLAEMLHAVTEGEISLMGRQVQ